ncbi:MAG: nucleoside triphosphate pyrophosphatase [Anaerolineae bacterium]
MPTLPLASPQKMRLILASTSPRRQELLRAIGLSFSIVPPTGVDETPLPGEAPADLVQRLSRLKAQAVATNLAQLAPPIKSSTEVKPQPIIIIAADTEVAFEGHILGKPGNPAAAAAMLQQLRGRCHQVYSGLTIASLPSTSVDPLHDGIFITRLHQSQVWMRAYSQADIAAYVASGDPLDKAGAYAIQHEGFTPVERLEGCFASVMGLPLGELAAACQELGLGLPEIGLLCAGYTGYPCCQNNR